MGRTAWRDPSVLSRVLRFGDAATREGLAIDIANGSADLIEVLASTARSEEDEALRARCVEVLGLALVGAGPDVAKRILDALLGRVGS
jgi:hypothetical protein